MGNIGLRLDTKRREYQTHQYKCIEALILREQAADTSNTTEDVTMCSSVEPKNYIYPFENLVFEGGGSKGMAYCGAVQYLEEVGAMSKIKRFGGTSAGAMMATFLAVGYKSADVKHLLGDDMEHICLDGGYFQAFRNLFWDFGYHPGRRLYDWLGQRLKQQTGSEDITFEEVRRKYGHEICVVVTNVNWMRTEYCHPKTTPDMPVRLALRMSMSIPGLFTATKYSMYGTNDLFVDGGIICNYPVHCYDGWHLSMKGDNFIQRFQSDRDTMEETRFSQAILNTKTLGMQVYSETERDFLRGALECRYGGDPLPKKPDVDTILYTKWKKSHDDMRRWEAVQHRLKQAMSSFFKIVDKQTNGHDNINRRQLEDVLRDSEFTRDEKDLLFGKNVNADEVFEILDRNKDDKIHYSELVTFVGELGIQINTSLDYRRRTIHNLYSFAHGVESTLFVNSKRINVKASDVKRTIGINTGHVITTDFDMEAADKEFLVKRGYNACKIFLQMYVEENKPQLKRV